MKAGDGRWGRNGWQRYYRCWDCGEFCWLDAGIKRCEHCRGVGPRRWAISNPTVRSIVAYHGDYYNG